MQWQVCDNEPGLWSHMTINNTKFSNVIVSLQVATALQQKHCTWLCKLFDPEVPTNDKSAWINQDWQHQACSHVRAGSGWGQDINREQVAHGSSQQISDNYQNYCTSFLLSKTKRVDKIRVEIISNTWRWRTYMFMVKADSGKGHSLWKTTRQVKAIWSKQESTQNLTNFPNF